MALAAPAPGLQTGSGALKPLLIDEESIDWGSAIDGDLSSKIQIGVFGRGYTAAGQNRKPYLNLYPNWITKASGQKGDVGA